MSVKRTRNFNSPHTDLFLALITFPGFVEADRLLTILRGQQQTFRRHAQSFFYQRSAKASAAEGMGM